MPGRYTGRHIRQARHGAWVNKKRSLLKPSRSMLPAAAALTVAGMLIGGAGTVIQLSAPKAANDLADSYDPADFPPPDREAQADRASRSGERTTAESDATANQTGANGVTSGSCEASYFSTRQKTASGETSDPNALTAAHRSLPFNSKVRVTNVANGKSVVVRINDRGPNVENRCLELSRAAFQQVSPLGAGVIDVRYEVLAQDAT